MYVDTISGDVHLVDVYLFVFFPHNHFLGSEEVRKESIDDGSLFIFFSRVLKEKKDRALSDQRLYIPMCVSVSLELVCVYVEGNGGFVPQDRVYDLDHHLPKAVIIGLLFIVGCTQ